MGETDPIVIDPFGNSVRARLDDVTFHFYESMKRVGALALMEQNPVPVVMAHPEINLQRLYKTHQQGAIARSGGAVLILVFALGGYYLGHLKENNIAGIGVATAYLLLMNLPVLWLLRWANSKIAAALLSLSVNMLEIIGYTAIIYFMGGLRGLWLGPIYVVLVIYVGLWGPPRQPFIVATLCGISAALMVWAEYTGLLPCQDPFPSVRMPGDVQAAMMITACGYLYVAAAMAAYMGNLVQRSRKKLERKQNDLLEKSGKLKAAQKELSAAHHQLEERVRERTMELAAANRQLASEIAVSNDLLEKLHQSEALLRETQRLTRLGGWSYDIATKNMAWTDEIYRIHELPKDARVDLIGNSISCYHKDDRPVIENAFRGAVEKGIPYDLELRLTTATGKPLWVRTIGEPYVEDGRVIRVSGNLMDITDRKQVEKRLKKSEERYKFLAENMGDIVWTLDTAFRNTYVSPSIEKILGYTLEERFNHTLEQMLTPDSYDRVLARFAEEVRFEETHSVDPNRAIVMEVEYYHKDGSTVWLENTVKAIRGPDNEVIGLYGVSRDIAERKQAEKDRLQLERQLQQAQKTESLGRMAGAVAHHFNNLLGAIMGNLELAMDVISSQSEARPNLDDAMSCAQRAAEISRLMLTYSGHGIGKRSLADLSATCNDALILLSASLSAKCRLKTKFPVNGPVARIDETQIKQVVSSIVVNAVEALEGGDGDVSIGIDVLPAEAITEKRFHPDGWKPTAPMYACLSIKDTGGGMTPQTEENVFDPFFSTKFTGRGLGLPVAIGVVKAHDGAIVMENNPGHGTIVEVFLPVVSEQRTETPPPHPQKCSRPEDGFVILLVEDEGAVREMASALLVSLGHTVVQASDGVEAVSAYQQHSIDIQCAVIDLNMPRMDGWQTLSALRQLRSDLPVILTSGYEKAQVMENELSGEVHAFLHKPYRRSGLEAAICAAMEKA